MDRTDEDRAEAKTCQECGAAKPDVAAAVIAGQPMRLCAACLPKLKAMDFFG